MGRAGWVLVLAVLAASGPARGQARAGEPPSVREPSVGEPGEGAAAAGIRTRPPAEPAEKPGREEGPPADRPRLRLELTGRVGFPIIGKVKDGLEATATGVDLQKDLHMPARPTWGVTALVDVELASWCSLGAVYWGMTNRAPSQEIHYRGVTVDDVTFPGDSRVRARLDVQYLELSLRYIWVNRENVRLWFGIGPAYVRLRLRLEGPAGRARAESAALLGPALTYQLEARVGVATLFLNNGITLGLSDRLPSFVSSSRLGVRWHLGGGFTFVTAFSFRNGLLTSWNEQRRRDRLTQGHEWDRARFSNAAVELGVAWAF